MSRTKKTATQPRRRHAPEFKVEALALADQIGTVDAAGQLKLEPSQLYAWRSAARKTANHGALDRELTTENARLKRELAESKMEVAILKKARAYFAKQLA